jgi:hypothetical protein
MEKKNIILFLNFYEGCLNKYLNVQKKKKKNYYFLSIIYKVTIS